MYIYIYIYIASRVIVLERMVSGVCVKTRLRRWTEHTCYRDGIGRCDRRAGGGKCVHVHVCLCVCLCLCVCVHVKSGFAAN